MALLALIDTLKTLITQLTPASVSLNDIQPLLGSVIKSYPNNSQLTPDAAHSGSISLINVTQKYKSEQVAHIDLTLIATLPLGELQTAFGEPKLSIPDNTQSKQAIFYIHQPAQATDIALIATLNRQGTEAIKITLRRDVHGTQ